MVIQNINIIVSLFRNILKDLSLLIRENSISGFGFFLDSKGNAYFCKEGYLRLSSYKFELDPDDPDNKFVHLTNIAV